MSEYKPGTVAMVTHNRKRMPALRSDRSWLVACCGNVTLVSDITPLVCIEATREDADALSRDIETSAKWLGPRRVRLAERLRDAIRDQLPAPLEIPERLGAVVEDANGHRWIYDGDPGTRPGEVRCPWVSSKHSGVRRTHSTARKLAVRVLSEGVA